MIITGVIDFRNFEEFRFTYGGTCNDDLRLTDIVPGKPVLTGSVQEPVKSWIVGNPVNDFKLEQSRFVEVIHFKEDDNG